MATDKFQTYRGDIRAAVGVEGHLAFVTVHPEGLPTALYWLDADKLGLQQDALPCGGVTLAADGNTVYAGGTDPVFDGQDKDEFEPGEADKLHDGAVTAILFEPEELRFFSAGADNKLLTTFARGNLEPEDKGRANMHEDVLTAMVMIPGDRFV